MYKARKKNLILLLIMLLSLVLAACGAGKTSESASKNKGSSSTTIKDNGEIDTSEFVTVTMLTVGDKPVNGQLEKVLEKVNAKLKEKVNANIELKWIEWADYMTKYNLALAQGESLDLIITADWLELWNNAQKGAFLDITDLLPKYAPETFAEVPEEHWEQSKVGGKIIVIPEDSYTQWINHGFFYRTDWAKEFGIDKIENFDTLEKYMQGIVDNKPGVIPWDTPGTNYSTVEGYMQAYTDMISLPIATGVVPVYWGKSLEDDPYTVVSPIFEDIMVENAKRMKEWHDKGFWRTDVLNYKGDTRNLFLAGKTGLDQHHTQTFSTLRTQMDNKQPGSEIDMFAFATQSKTLPSTSITHGALSVGAHSKHPERALMVYDLIRNDEEIYRLFNYGIEGVQYEIKDDKLVRPDGYDETNDSFTTNFWGGRVDKFEIVNEEVWDGIDEVYAAYDKIKTPYPYGGFVFDSSPVEAELAAISQVTAQLIPAIAFGKVADPEKAVEELRMRLEQAGYEKVLNEIQKQLDEHYK